MADNSSPDYEALYRKAEAERRQAEERERQEAELRRQAEEREAREKNALKHPIASEKSDGVSVEIRISSR
ncbi:hypothetical protein EMCG_08046 [[Emmonsia] crescens]|uniref:Uncharacterized protein n=1 Tax=[Emmonsia] crescens TaxID=73230 RepID=A0A0G2J4X0_9EURO|nr:hypothetical protein EMCG_08046 [Emmonsia crescens UAMH 3008]